MGFKNLSRFNDALLAKQTWCLLHDKSLLFYRIFKAKFFPNYSIMEATCPSLASYAWKSIIRGREVIKWVASWRNGDGKPVAIWGDGWLPLKHSPKILSMWVDTMMDAKVCQFIDEEQKSWKADLLEVTLLSFRSDYGEKYFSLPHKPAWWIDLASQSHWRING